MVATALRATRSGHSNVQSVCTHSKCESPMSHVQRIHPRIKDTRPVQCAHATSCVVRGAVPVITLTTPCRVCVGRRVAGDTTAVFSVLLCLLASQVRNFWDVFSCNVIMCQHSEHP